MKITPGHGVGPIRLGATEDEMRQAIGEPERSEHVTIKGGDWIEWHYDSQGFSLYFDADAEFRLVTIDVDNPEVEIEGFRPIGVDEEQVLEALEDLGEVEMEDDMPDVDRRVYELVGTEVWFWFSAGVCDSIQVSALLDDEGLYVWV